jgi:hypothetical protein
VHWLGESEGHGPRMRRTIGAWRNTDLNGPPGGSAGATRRGPNATRTLGSAVCRGREQATNSGRRST